MVMCNVYYFGSLAWGFLDQFIQFYSITSAHVERDYTMKFMILQMSIEVLH